MLEFSIATISIFVGVLNELVKWISHKCFNYDIKKYIPIFSIGFGLILGIACYFTPNIDMGKNLLEAIFIGIASGGNAVGFHQVYKQLTKSNGIIEDVASDHNDETTNDDTDIDVPVDETEVVEEADDVEEDTSNDYAEDE